MAIGHISVRMHSRGKGHSAAAALAYRCGVALTCSRTGERHDYSRRSERHEVAATGLTDGPFRTAGELADAIENAERRKDATLLRDVQPAIPAELDEPQGVALIERFAGKLSERYNTQAAWAVHPPDKRSDARNRHGHIVLPTRRLEDGHFAKTKIRELDDRFGKGPGEIAAIRKLWETCANEALLAAEVSARVDTGRTADPAPTLGPERTGIERRAYRTRNGHHPRGLSVPELVADGAVTGAGRRVTRHRSARKRRRRPERAQAVAKVSGVGVGVRLESETASHGHQRAPDAVSSALLQSSPDRSLEIAAIDRELAELEHERQHLHSAEAKPAFDFNAWLHEEPEPEEPAMPVESKPPFDPTAEQWRSDLFPAAPAKTPAPVEPAVRPQRQRGEDWSIRGMTAAAARQRCAADPVDTPTTEAKSALEAFLQQDQPGAPDSPSLDQGNEPDPEPEQTDHAREPPRAESKDSETEPLDETARQRRRAGARVAAHADNAGIPPTAQESTRAQLYLAGGYEPDLAPRPSLDRAIDQCARARLVGEPLAVDPLAQACASTAGANTARRMTEASVDGFKREHPPQGSILSALEQWRRTLKPGLVKRILTVIVPLEVQHARDQARRARQAPAQRPPDPDFWS